MVGHSFAGSGKRSRGEIYCAAFLLLTNFSKSILKWKAFIDLIMTMLHHFICNPCPICGQSCCVPPSRLCATRDHCTTTTFAQKLQVLLGRPMARCRAVPAHLFKRCRQEQRNFVAHRITKGSAHEHQQHFSKHANFTGFCWTDHRRCGRCLAIEISIRGKETTLALCSKDFSNKSLLHMSCLFRF